MLADQSVRLVGVLAVVLDKYLAVVRVVEWLQG